MSIRMDCLRRFDSMGSVDSYVQFALHRISLPIHTCGLLAYLKRHEPIDDNVLFNHAPVHNVCGARSKLSADWLVGSLACLLVGLFACLLACLLARLLARLLVGLLACWLARSLAGGLSCLVGLLGWLLCRVLLAWPIVSCRPG